MLTRVVRGCLALAAGLSLVAAPAAAATRASADGTDPTFTMGTSLRSTALHVTSSTGRQLRVRITADRMPGDDADRTVLRVTVSRGRERHDWTFYLDRSDFGWSNSRGEGHITTGEDLRQFGRLRLKISAAGAPLSHCSGTKRRQVSVSGMLAFDTRSGKRGWGRLAARSDIIRFPAGSTIRVAPHGPCETSSAPCPKGVSYEGSSDLPGYSHVEFSGGAAAPTAHAHLRVVRTVPIASGSAPVRTDSVRLRLPAGAIRRAHGHYELRLARGAGHGTGTAMLRSGTAGEELLPTTCGPNDEYTVPATTYRARWRNGKHPMLISEAITGQLRVPDTSRADFLVFGRPT